MKDWLRLEEGREPSAAADPGWEGGLGRRAGKDGWQVSTGRDPRKPQAHGGPGWVKGAAAVLVGEATTTNAHMH